ncbi:MAG TPA: 5-(carboxyamino)imidazole ribonucleotide synthase [Catalimonadaceae bacterium]|nr:5-(carboxyamino)imidazole ribonucleotide synthase [Catalimonadaceae bacterium]
MKDKRIGILGGGQLGLMMAQACADWHLEPVFLEPDPEAAVLPYGKVVQGSFRDNDTVRSFGADFDVISYEIEDVNLDAIKELEAGGKQVYPQPSVLEIIKNKKRQKYFLVENGFPTSPFVDFLPSDLSLYSDFLPAFWKQDEGGYDGKGVMRVGSPSDFSRLPDSPGFLEKGVSIQKEIAVIVARNASGEVKTFPSVEMVFHPEANLVEYLQCPAQISTENNRTCEELAIQLISRLNMIGLLAVEFFIDENGQVLVNEMAPRPHNSGHHTIEANLTSQFSQYWRAILNLPLGDPRQIHPFAAMINLIGEEGYNGKPVYQGLEEVLSQSGVFVHIYGKSQTRPYRKMGHVTVVADSLADLQQKVSFVKNHLKVIA